MLYPYSEEDLSLKLLHIIALICGLATVTVAQDSLQLKLTINTGDLANVGFSPDGQLLATTSGQKTEVRLWDTHAGTLKARLSGKDDPFSTLQGASYPKQFLSGSSSFSFSPDGRLLAEVALMARELRVWDLETGKRAFTLTHLSDMRNADFSPDGRLLALAAGFQGLQLLDLQAGKISATRWDVKRVNGVYGAAFIQGGNTLIAAIDSDEKGKTGFYLFDVATGKVRAMIPTSKEGGNQGLLSHDGRSLAVVDASNNVQLWDTASGRLVTALGGVKGKVVLLAFSQDGKTIAIASGDHTVTLWDSEKAEVKATMVVQERVILVFSPTGAFVATAGASGVKIWDSATGVLKQALSDAVSPIAFSPGGGLLVTGGKGHTGLLWQLPVK